MTLTHKLALTFIALMALVSIGMGWWLACIGSFQAENEGVSPSFEEMKEALGLKSKSGVHRPIDALVERGRLTRRPNRARALEIIPEASELESYPTALLVAELARRSEENRRAA